MTYDTYRTLVIIYSSFSSQFYKVAIMLKKNIFAYERKKKNERIREKYLQVPPFPNSSTSFPGTAIFHIKWSKTMVRIVHPKSLSREKKKFLS